ncbi:MAG TPA: PhnD/SsuA/transferrin family substrate-binding protein [Gemmataceae bacterium]|nr:PhnD/SsuA/transferrin family substrate-binding protein [Gemmataceae bacterium]
MRAVRWWLLSGVTLAGLVVFAGVPAPTVHAEEPRPVQIGLPQNLFRDFPRITVEALMPTFTRLMESQTGMKGKVMLLTGPEEVGKNLADDKIQLAVFHGFEFAWEQNKHPDFKPLVIVVKQNAKLTAQVIVANDTSVSKLEDLKGQPVAIPRGTPEHCRLFLSRRTRMIGTRQEKFFGAFSTPAHVAAALDDVAAGKVKATVVDSVAWDNYQWMNPQKAAKLKPLMQSEPFPTGVIAYKEGGLPEADLKRFRDGLTHAHERSDGMQLMMLWKMKRFDVAPADFQQSLADIAKAYPPPIGDEP